MTTSTLPGASDDTTPIIVRGTEHPRDILNSADFGVETPEDVVAKRGQGEQAEEIADALSKKPGTTSLSPDDALKNEKNRLAYAEVQDMRKNLGTQGSEEIETARGEIQQLTEAITFRRTDPEMKDEEQAAALESELSEKQQALEGLIGASVKPEQKPVLIAYGKKRLAQIASLEVYLKHSNRKEAMRATRTKMNDEIGSMKQELDTVKGQITTCGQKITEEEEKTPKNTILITSLGQRKTKLEEQRDTMAGQIKEKVALMESMDTAIRKEGMGGASTEGAQQTVVTLESLAAEREDIIKKLGFLDVSPEDIKEIILTSQTDVVPANAPINTKPEKVTRLLRSDTGESISKMSDLVKDRVGEDEKLANITALNVPTENPCFYTAEIVKAPTNRKILMKVQPGSPVLLIGGDGKVPSSVAVTTLADTKVVVSTETHQGTYVYRFFDQETGEMLSEIRMAAYIQRGRAITTTLSGTVVEIEYRRGSDTVKGIANIHTGEAAASDVERHYELLEENKTVGGFQANVENRYREKEYIMGPLQEFIKNLQQRYFVWKHTDGSLCLMSQEDYTIVGYIDPRAPWGKNDNGELITMVYKRPIFESDGQINFDHSYGDVYNLSTQEVIYEDGSLRRSYDTPNTKLGLDMTGVFVKNKEGMRVFVDYVTGVASLMGKGDVQTFGNYEQGNADKRGIFMIVDQSRNAAQVYYTYNRGQESAGFSGVGEFPYIGGHVGNMNTLVPEKIIAGELGCKIVVFPMQYMVPKKEEVYYIFDKDSGKTFEYKGYKRIGDQNATLALYQENSSLPKAMRGTADVEIDLDKKEGTMIRAIRVKPSKKK